MVLVGATTENPYFEVNSALLSRAQVYELHELTPEDVAGLLRRALDAASAATARVDDDVIEFLAARSGGDARTALNALELALRRPPRAPGERGHAGRRRGRDAAQGRPLRQGRRPALRLHLGLDQVDARLGPRRVALLPRGDARGRRGPALHRAADGRSSPPRTSATPTRRRCRWRSPRRTRSSTSGLPEAPVRARAGGDLPLAGAEVQRRQARDRRRARAHPRARRRAAARPRCARPPTRRRAGSAAARATTTRTTTRATSTTRSTCPPGSRTLRFYAPDDADGTGRERLAEIRRARGAEAVSAAYGRPATPRELALRPHRPLLLATRARTRGSPPPSTPRSATRARCSTSAAGSGSYEPRDRDVLAVEPLGGHARAAARRARRRASMRAAEALPFADGGVRRGDGGVLRPPLAGPRRPGCASCAGSPGGGSSLVQWDQACVDAFWLARDYLRRARRRAALRRRDGAARRRPSSARCRSRATAADGFLLAWWARPEALLDPRRAGQRLRLRAAAARRRGGASPSGWRRDLADGDLGRAQPGLRERAELDVGLRLVVAGAGSATV